MKDSFSFVLLGGTQLLKERGRTLRAQKYCLSFIYLSQSPNPPSFFCTLLNFFYSQPKNSEKTFPHSINLLYSLIAACFLNLTSKPQKQLTHALILPNIKFILFLFEIH